MDFRIDALLPATAAQLWAIFFDVKRVAALIPGCDNVVEVENLKEFSAVMRQKIGPFKLEVPTAIHIDSYDPQRQVSLKAAGCDKATGTTIDVGMVVNLEEQRDGDRTMCKLDVTATMQVAGRLASLGYPIVRKRSEQLFAEFEQRLRDELSGVGQDRSPAQQVASATTPTGRVAPTAVEPRAAADATPSAAAQPAQAAASPAAPVPAAREPRATVTELVFLWPRLGINVAVAIGVAHGAVALGESHWWWLAAPLLGVAASLGKRGA
ncbi:hypothetical protein CAL18_02210 [Bordetella genomosp. 7]|uniref:Carbon monoxide dehydrogenase n=1 Tax=Bordetella genomosp. 7 TaxID=1416805 RepID=A0A261RHB3_9BORD|nr:SRPBCC domain-containing protein [Bordetella genomosp. 7]OZI24426.1 hypothetical protein CAL19_02590 [Bordetella genomosp. 7]OZI28617.1 hypothetical protein CAL18_02210 [Bordetella genomosp. 7]